MNPLRFVGMALLVAAIMLPIIGFTASRSGPDGPGATWYIIGGVAAALLGVQLVLFGVPGRHAGRS